MKLSNRCWLAWLAVLECCHLATGVTSYPPDVIQQVESTLLSLFGHAKRPGKMDRSKLVIPDEMIRLYELQSGLKFATSNIPKKGAYLTTANTVRSFVHVESSIDRRFQTSHKIRLKFDPNVPKEEVLQHAELALKRTKPGTTVKFRILVEDILKPGRKGQHEPIKRVIDSKILDPTKNSTLKLDLTEAVIRWVKDPKTNHGLLLTVLDASGTENRHVQHNLRIKRSYQEDDRTWSDVQPILYTYTDDNKNTESDIRDVVRRIRRSKRAARRGRRKNSEHSVCMRHRMHVNFEDVGWSDWIVAPPSYDAFYCQGVCQFPLADHLNATNHAIVQTLMNSMSPTVPQACCVPTQLNSISMLYLDMDNKVVLKNYKEMVVVGCGCR